MRRRTRFALGAVLVLALGPVTIASRSDPSGFVGDYHWQSTDPLFGGWSGLEVVDEGNRLYALSDRGAWTEARIQRDDKGRIATLQAEPVRILDGAGDLPLPGDSRDSEGLAIAEDGTAYVSFEGPARVMRYPALGKPGKLLPSPPEFVEMTPNGSLEALAVDAEGTLFTLPEETIRNDGLTPIFRFRNGVWDQPWLLPVDGSLIPRGPISGRTANSI